MSNQVAAPFCAVEIYPFEGGGYTLTPGQILECHVEKNIRQTVGRFTLLLAPGGPLGTSAQPSWTQIITPMSFVMIGMRRWKYSNIVMLGVVTEVSEDQVWTPEGVQRVIRISGGDFGVFFEMFNWIALTFLGGLVAANLSPGGLPTILGADFTQGRPDQVAENWFNTIMMGTKGVLANTNVQWGNQQIQIGAAMGALIETFPVNIPYASSYITVEGSWMQKLRAMLLWPIYETFVITAPVDAYKTNAAPGMGFTMKSLGPAVVATPFFVGRLNPTPLLTGQVTAGAGSITGIDSSKWNGLVDFQQDSGFLRSEVRFDESDVRNFYLVNPTWFGNMYGSTNASHMSWTQSFGGFYDADSLHRYGFRPELTNTEWFTDFNGSLAQQKDATVQSFGLEMTLRVASWYHPTPLMAKGGAMYPLRPDIYPGNRFSYQPFKAVLSGQQAIDYWDFYIEGVRHDFVFGRQSTTTLTLCRGLPSDIYHGTGAGSVLYDVFTGNARRFGGAYQAGSGGGGLTSWGLDNAKQFANTVAQVWTTPQKP